MSLNPIQTEEWLAQFRDAENVAKLSKEQIVAATTNGLLNHQDEYGMSALMLCIAYKWQDTAYQLLHCKPDTSLYYFRTGETALHMAVLDNQVLIPALLEAGANPDQGNHYGVTPRQFAEIAFEHLPVQAMTRPAPRVQNAEHLAEHFYPRFKIPKRKERATLKIGQAVDLYVFGPQEEGKQNTVKARICEIIQKEGQPEYLGNVETAAENIHLLEGTSQVQFGPEHVASVYLARPK
jgi:hypothetical protein